MCETDRKSTRLNSSHLGISYAVFCLKKSTRSFHSRPAAGGAERARKARRESAGPPRRAPDLPAPPACLSYPAVVASHHFLLKTTAHPEPPPPSRQAPLT